MDGSYFIKSARTGRTMTFSQPMSEGEWLDRLAEVRKREDWKDAKLFKEIVRYEEVKA